MRTAFAIAAFLAVTVLPASPSTATSSGSDGPDSTDQVSVSMRVGGFRDRVIEITNIKRRSHGCDNLRKNDALGVAAQRHTARMANAGNGGTLSHLLAGEASLGTRIARAGYDWSFVGENIASYYPTPADVVSAWMHSRSHRANILNCRFRHIGVGYAVADNGRPYWTQDFGRR